MTTTPTGAAMRAAEKIVKLESPDLIRDIARIIDKETGLRELVEALKDAPEKLRLLANWLDLVQHKHYPEWGARREVQDDLRRWADALTLARVGADAGRSEQ